MPPPLSGLALQLRDARAPHHSVHSAGASESHKSLGMVQTSLAACHTMSHRSAIGMHVAPCRTGHVAQEMTPQCNRRRDTRGCDRIYEAHKRCGCSPVLRKNALHMVHFGPQLRSGSLVDCRCVPYNDGRGCWWPWRGDTPGSRLDWGNSLYRRCERDTSCSSSPTHTSRLYNHPSRTCAWGKAHHQRLRRLRTSTWHTSRVANRSAQHACERNSTVHNPGSQVLGRVDGRRSVHWESVDHPGIPRWCICGSRIDRNRSRRDGCSSPSCI